MSVLPTEIAILENNVTVCDFSTALQHIKISSMKNLLKLPVVILMFLAVITGMTCDSFLTMALGLQLNNFVSIDTFEINSFVNSG